MTKRSREVGPDYVLHKVFMDTFSLQAKDEHTSLTVAGLLAFADMLDEYDVRDGSLFLTAGSSSLNPKPQSISVYRNKDIA